MINVTKTFLPPYSEYQVYLMQAWERAWITNNGPLVLELEKKLKEYLNVKHLFFCSNGTIAIQIALKVLNITQEVITTPFSYVATTASIIWENCTPVFVDIKPDDLNIDERKIEAAITEHTQAIMAVHVFGNPCQVHAFEEIAQKHNLKVIYDGAHAFGATYQNKSLLSFGDISTCSFHATKVFHTVEGGAIITNNDDLARKIKLYRSFGHEGDNYYSIGVNGKNSEFHAAMGLANFSHLSNIIEGRKNCSHLYAEKLSGLGLQFPIPLSSSVSNYTYFPVIFNSEETLLKVKNTLLKNEVNCRRYFYPSLNQLPYYTGSSCPFSEDISPRILCLPLYFGLTEEQVVLICDIIQNDISV
jgi:dTDP-4-amino-4,6-dideoxygalactose transaminase